MSRNQILQRLLLEERLLELPSLFTGGETARSMIISTEVSAAVTPPFADTDEGLRLAEFRQLLDAFSEGGQISVAEDPHEKPPDAMLARVDPIPEEFWSIRVTHPEESAGIRCLGAFADTDKFIALTWDYRETIGIEFDQEVAAVRAAWRDLFGSEEPFSGDRLDEYLTNFYPV